nr:MAG TPA: hypothetical protein [Caudoviricetes sp.]
MSLSSFIRFFRIIKLLELFFKVFNLKKLALIHSLVVHMLKKTKNNCTK